ncbi:hypothetical protein L873DRAFT_1848401 [Choiromyces venosus 120613-1]|uniref:C2H2-type domain-containing protein n=1 Tax=Choiromyces venosus 120613-1 TaxID=1336337 RepID=A0A3N4J3L0_9PEZI|nr:hypothetical protein L873DRAFT_1848401 [Choiromyces venosus 120613-1]
MAYQKKNHLSYDAPHGFTLVCFDESGKLLDLPAGLGDLPLHPDQDGWYSVLGSWDGTTDIPETANEVNEEIPENKIAIPIPQLNRPRNARPILPIIFCEYDKCAGHCGPHACEPGRITCKAPSCSSSGNFKTKQAFSRHYLSKHLDDRVDCPVEGCPRVGVQGIKRKDNLAAHILNKHGIPSSRPPISN